MKILSIGIHMDDCEFGMGGIAALLAERGHEVLFVNQKPYMHYIGGVPGANEQSIHAAELLSAQKIILDYDQTKYFKNNEKTTRELEEIIRDFKPDIAFIMHPKDNHIEHVESYLNARDALFAAAVDGIAPNEVYTYECGPNQSMIYFVPDILVNVTPVEETLKESLVSFAQKHADGDRLWREKTVIAELRGHVCGARLAEALKVIKFPEGNNGFFLLDALKDCFFWNGSKMYYPRTEEFI